MALFKRNRRSIRRILIVEDEPLVAFDNEHHLGLAGYEVVATVDRGEDALRFLAEDRVDAVILDVGLAGQVNGIAVAIAAAHGGIPVLFVTGQCPGEAKPYAYACLSKPYPPAALVAALAVVDALVQGREPDALPPGLTLFRTAEVR